MQQPTAAPTPPSASDRLAKQVKRITRIVIGFTLILIGAFFGFVPLIPGWPLGLLGLSMLAAAEVLWARRLLRRVQSGATRLRDVLFPRRAKRRRPPEDKPATG